MTNRTRSAKKPLIVGLMGLGNMGQNHLRVLSSLASADVAWIYDLDTEKAKRLATTYDTHAIDDLDSALSQAEAVIICTPSSCHYDDLKRVSVKVDKIFIEKPLAADLETSRKALDLVKSKNLHVQVGFIERFNPVVRELRKVMLASGKPINIDFTRTNRLSSRIKDVDVITDLMIHDIDLALHFNGPVRSVSAIGTTEKNDTGKSLICFGSAQLIHESGSFSRIIASRVTDKKIRRIEATCTDKYIDCELVRKELLVYRQSQIAHTADNYSISGTTETVEVRQEEALMSELQAFVQFAQGALPPGATVPTAADGLAAMEICSQIIQKI